MARCTRTTNLEIHHIRRDGGNDISNAQVLCQKCHRETHSYGRQGHSPTPFPQDVKDKALKKAGYQCECTSGYQGCH
jgi:5-methylcytosine-specific restriction endonuclease McrA